MRVCMAVDRLADPEALALELKDLLRREPEISALRQRLFDRLAVFPNEFTQRQERRVSAERKAIHRRIDELYLQVKPLLRTRD